MRNQEAGVLLGRSSPGIGYFKRDATSRIEEALVEECNFWAIGKLNGAISSHVLP